MTQTEQACPSCATVGKEILMEWDSPEPGYERLICPRCGIVLEERASR